MNPSRDNKTWIVSHFMDNLTAVVDVERLARILGNGRVIAERNLTAMNQCGVHILNFSLGGRWLLSIN